MFPSGLWWIKSIEPDTWNAHQFVDIVRVKSGMIIKIALVNTETAYEHLLMTVCLVLNAPDVYIDSH